MDTRRWTRHLLPLPKQIRIHGTTQVLARNIALSVLGSGEIVDEASRQVRAAIGAASDEPASPTFTIELALADDTRLTELPNNGQAYRIDHDGENGLRVSALQPAGLLYGAITLCQLLRAGRSDSPDNAMEIPQVEVPLVEITDWPDIEERGLWNFPDPAGWIPWMASVKLNYGKMAATEHAPVVRGEAGSARLDTELFAVGRRLAFSYMPFIVHLNFLHDIGLFTAYPELAGKGDKALAGRYFAHKQGNQHRAPCASQPVLVDLLTDWLSSIASQGASEISCWLSERPCQCQCQACTPVGQFLLETRAFVAAWERVRADHPDLTIRIFSSTTTPEQDHLVLAELPPEVKFERACATSMDRVSAQPRDLFSNPLIDTAAAAGRWVATYDVPIGAFGSVDTPEFKVPQFSAQRIRHFVRLLHERNYAGAYGMLAWGTMGREVCGFAICALAEYAWNGDGRSIEDFAEAWATLEGHADPTAVGAWANLLGEVEFDVYDADFPMSYSWGHAADAVKQRRAPQLGEGMFRYFLAPQDFNDRLQTCDEALGLVQDLREPEFALATRVVRSYVALSQAIWNVSHHFAHLDLTDPETHAQLRADLQQLQQAGTSNVDAIVAWRTKLGPEPWHHRVHDATQATRDTVRRIDSHIRDRCLY